jgi:hypothetical protein
MLISRRDFLRRSALVSAGIVASDAVVLGSRAVAASDAGALLARAVSFEIHPTVGIARVGNSADAFFFGPEVPGGVPRPRGGFKDASGAMARQAARFRVYAIGRTGEVLGEVPAGASVQWTVSVANKKAAWYESAVAMDISVASPVSRRNPTITGSGRNDLAAAVTKSVRGRAAPPIALDGPAVFDNPIDFGEILTDPSGRLVVMPGNGRAYPAPGATITTFADNDGWTDNVCDGTVEAVVDIGGRRIRAQSAYLLVSPPNYGPAIAGGPITLLDQVRSPLTLAGLLTPSPVTFEGDILPFLRRLVDMQWVNKGFFTMTRPRQEMDWLSPENLNRLADPSPANRAYRTSVARRFRNPAFQSSNVSEQPLLWGDGTRIPPTNQYSWLAVTTLQYLALQQWARGDFAPGSPHPTATTVDQLPLAQRPRALDEASLDSILGGANHPGVEAPWVLRVPSMWVSAYRLRTESTAMAVRDYGSQLTPSVTMSADGPVHGVSPGDLTMWMGVPWHADAASCRSGYRTPGYAPNISPFLPAFWPARVPNEVLTERDYETVMDRRQSLAVRKAAFARRRTWLRPLATVPTATQQLTDFVTMWPTFGVVTEKTGPGDRSFPQTMKVETGVSYQEPTPTSATTYPCSATPGITCPIEW